MSKFYDLTKAVVEIETQSLSCLTFRFFEEVSREYFTDLVIISHLLETGWTICESDRIERSSYWTLESI